MIVSDLSSVELRDRLRRGAFALRTGPVSARITSPVPEVADAITSMYAAYPLVDDEAFIDFHVGIRSPPGVRRWWRPLARFYFDGASPFTPLPLAHAYPMLEWGLNWCISSHCHQYLTIHAAAVERDGRAVILPAPPGSGKSTLCAGLVARGWRLLSDELALIRLQDGLLQPVPRPISLKNRSIDLIREYADGSVFSATTRETTKGDVAYMCAPADSVGRAAEPVRAAAIVFPRYVSGASAALVPVARARAFLRVAENSFNYDVLGEAGFRCLGAVFDQCLAYEFSYGSLDDAIATFADL